MVYHKTKPCTHHSDQEIEHHPLYEAPLMPLQVLPPPTAS